MLMRSPRGASVVQMRSFCALLLVGIVTIGRAGDLSPLESKKIDFLINTVETLEDATFVRNGTPYDAKTAANHLRRKLKSAGSRVKSADDFIRYCATASSISGIPYQIRFSDGRVVSSEAFLRAKLAGFPAQ
jgi:Family of unknown function (DUF5329)